MLPTLLVFHRRCLISLCLNAYFIETLFLSASQEKHLLFFLSAKPTFFLITSPLGTKFSVGRVSRSLRVDSIVFCRAKWNCLLRTQSE